MPPRIQDGLEHFFHWLTDEGSVAATSAKTYTISVRKTLKVLGNSRNSDALWEVFQSFYEDKPLQYTTARSAWEKYRMYSKSVLGEELPVSPTVRKIRESKRQYTAPSLPPECRDAIRELKACGMSYKDMVTCTWGDVQDLSQMLHTSIAYIQVPDKPEGTEFWKVNAKPLRDLWDYANVGGDLSLPLVPKRPGNAFPFSYSALSAEAKKYTPEQMREMLKPKETSVAQEKPETPKSRRKSNWALGSEETSEASESLAELLNLDSSEE